MHNGERVKKLYPPGTQIKISHISEYGYHPEMVGKVVTVEFVDDECQVFCVDDEGHRATVCAEYGDRFFKV